MMALYTMADLHLSLSCDKPMDVFGSRWKNHIEKLQSLWNKIVTPSDTVVIGGDISWAITLEEAREDLLFIHRLNGKKILMRGNHDYWWSSLKKINDLFVSEGIDDILILQNNSFNVGNFTVCGTRGWYIDPQLHTDRNCDNKKVVAREAQRLELSLTHAAEHSEGRELVCFTHFPPFFSSFICHEIIDVLHRFNVKYCYFGHIHGSACYSQPPYSEYEGIRFYIVSADYLDFRPKAVIGPERLVV